MKSEKNYKGWQCLVLGNESLELLIPQEIGPRVVFLGSPGGKNLFHVVEEDAGKSGEPDWHLRGGHRLWHAPESMPRTYDPDNHSIIVSPLSGGREGYRLVAHGKDPAGMLKAIEVELLPDNTFKLIHEITNKTPWPIQFAPWALTVLERGGYGVLPLLPKGDHSSGDFLPKYSVVPWTYTDLSLPVWKFHSEYIGVDTEKADRAQKIGLTGYPGWSAYWQENGTFVKYAKPVPGENHPDLGCMVEIFTNELIIEMETLAPFSTVEPGQTVRHVEYWTVFHGQPRPDNDAVFASSLKPEVEAWLERLS